MTVTVEAFESPDALDARDQTAMTAIFNAVWAEWIVGEPPVSEAAFLDLERLGHLPEVQHRRLARDAGGALVGFGDVGWREGEPGHAHLSLKVAPDRRGVGVGRALGAELAAVARRAGRTSLTIEARYGDRSAEICAKAGAVADMVVEVNRTRVSEIPQALLESWQRSGEAADGYSLVAYDAPCPPALAEAFTAVRHVMNDAPRYAGEGEATFTVDELRAAEASIAGAGQDWWCLGVRDEASGEIVGLSEMYLPVRRPWLVLQGDTGVAPAHRGHGLGAWMKAVNHLRLVGERPEAEIVQTWNASANQPMLRINRALGFEPVQRFQGWSLALV